MFYIALQKNITQKKPLKEKISYIFPVTRYKITITDEILYRFDPSIFKIRYLEIDNFEGSRQIKQTVLRAAT